MKSQPETYQLAGAEAVSETRSPARPEFPKPREGRADQKTTNLARSRNLQFAAGFLSETSQTLQLLTYNAPANQPRQGFAVNMTTVLAVWFSRLLETRGADMKNYLSLGGGVNSIALYLLMQDLGMEFEAVFIDHSTDWPETYAYVDYFIATGRPVTILKPEYKGFTSLFEFCFAKRMTPNRLRRWCTDQFKVRPFQNYAESPCFVHLGIDAGEAHRARLASKGGYENRYLLIEHDIDRQGCIELIKAHGLNVPIKSGCFICPFQRRSQWRQLRMMHPELYCAAQKLEQTENESRRERGKKPFFTLGKNSPLSKFINDKQPALPGLESMEYPPCQCGL